MALYAFDGTWQDDEASGVQNQKDTNVVRFLDAYQGKTAYMEGIGVRKGVFGRLIGGLTGAGGRTRIREALKHLEENVMLGDETVDVVGFSRGASLALHFTNQVERRYPEANIRFVGLWDTVASFGIPGNRINIGWQLTLANRVKRCYHMMALDERRSAFPLTRVRGKGKQTIEEPRLLEVWFRGSHSDVGSWINPPLNNISLCWLLKRAVADGLPINEGQIEAARQLIQANAPITPNSGRTTRRILPGDNVHESVEARGTINGVDHNDPPAPPAVVIVGD